MKYLGNTLLIIALTLLVANQNAVLGQTAPDLGSTAGFAVFTAAGALNNYGTTSSTIITGDVGSNSAIPSGFPPGIVNGNIYQTGDPEAAQAATDIAVAYGDLTATTCGTVIGVGLGNGQILTAGVYCQGAASTLNGILYLDGAGNPDALFIIKIGGAFATGLNATVALINSASACNVYWQINGQFDLAAGSVFAGTVVVNGAINLLDGSQLYGRALSTAGAVSLYNNIITPYPGEAGTISGTSTVCQKQSGVLYSVPAIHHATSYTWILPANVSIIAGAGTNTITVSFGAIATSGSIRVYGTNACGSGVVSADYLITVNPVPAISTIFH